MGEPTDVICVKGSGWDLGDIEPQGLPAMHLAPLQRMEALDPEYPLIVEGASTEQLPAASAFLHRLAADLDIQVLDEP